MSNTLEFQIKEKISSLSEKILSKHPSIPGLLQEIHTALLKNPEQVTLLSEEEMNIIFQGLELQTGTFLISESVNKPASKSTMARIKSLGLEAFGG